MRVNTVYLIICFFLCVFGLNAYAQPGGVEKKIKKFISANGNGNEFRANDVFVVRFDHQLTAKEIQNLQPRKQLTADYFIIDQRNVSSLSKNVIYQARANGLWKASDGLMNLINKNGKKKIKELFERIELNPISESKEKEDDSKVSQTSENTEKIES